jgi:hypothetical protein
MCGLMIADDDYDDGDVQVSFNLQVLYHFFVLEVVNLFACTNLNYMMAPPPGTLSLTRRHTRRSHSPWLHPADCGSNRSAGVVWSVVPRGDDLPVVWPDRGPAPSVGRRRPVASRRHPL